VIIMAKPILIQLREAQAEVERVQRHVIFSAARGWAVGASLKELEELNAEFARIAREAEQERHSK
jgi:hypothetical protein